MIQGVLRSVLTQNASSGSRAYIRTAAASRQVRAKFMAELDIQSRSVTCYYCSEYYLQVNTCTFVFACELILNYHADRSTPKNSTLTGGRCIIR